MVVVVVVVMVVVVVLAVVSCDISFFSLCRWSGSKRLHPQTALDKLPHYSVPGDGRLSLSEHMVC